MDCKGSCAYLHVAKGSVLCRNSGCQPVILPLSFLIVLPVAPVTNSHIRTILPFSPAFLIFFQCWYMNLLFFIIPFEVGNPRGI